MWYKKNELNISHSYLAMNQNKVELYNPEQTQYESGKL